jgi:hypothetical protein
MFVYKEQLQREHIQFLTILKTNNIITVLPTYYTGRFLMFFVITNIYNKKTKGPTLMELFTATGKLK